MTQKKKGQSLKIKIIFKKKFKVEPLKHLHVKMFSSFSKRQFLKLPPGLKWNKFLLTLSS